nr:ABC transporter permease [Micromonospora sp. DSM 115978]
MSSMRVSGDPVTNHDDPATNHDGPAAGGARRRGRSWHVDGIWPLLAIIIVVGGLLKPIFLDLGNLNSVFIAAVPLVLLAIGQSVVLFTREIDLSVGSTVSLSAIICGDFMADDPNLILPVALLALLAGAAVGLFNGIVVTRLGVPSFVVTLGSLLIVRGLIFLWTGGAPKSSIPNELVNWLTGTLFLGIAAGSLTVFAVAGAVAWYVAHRSHFGRRALLIGAGPDAARLAGLPVSRTVIKAYVLSGVYAAAAGLYYTAWIGSVRGDQGSGLELDAIAAAVLGGVSLFGGYGHIGSAIAGALSLSLIFNLLILLGFPIHAQSVGKGVILIVSVLAYERLRDGGLWRRIRNRVTRGGG